ncbi:phage tail protein [Vibrio furnissii]|uniref:phage tail-collar fiber domain-containing protein n=1 Tax=Vibrio furnissii TaxID=29494 RepID=UPI000200DACA|nr:phage tail protein [Vibrio furnissii]ADT87626.1 Phage-related tail fiber protein [Vibrio furnissii NCTC 11218]
MANTTDKSILTAAGKALLAQLNAEEKPLIIDKMIFANVPNRPEFPQPDDVVPNDSIVHQEGVEQRGRLSADSVIYSTTLTSDVGPFEFNWTGAYCSEYGVLVTVDHHALTPKTADEPGVAGNTLVRSVVLEYKDIAEITNITVDASTWQYNATERLKKMDTDVAQAIIDQNGKDWFIEDGFLVTPQGIAFNIKAGAGYVSGNRVTLDFDRNVQVPNKPSFIYVDAHREGTPTGEQVTLFDFVVTAEEKDDYTDANGVKHFVCKIAQVLADGSVSDLRPEGESATRDWSIKTSGKFNAVNVMEYALLAGFHKDSDWTPFFQQAVDDNPTAATIVYPSNIRAKIEGTVDLKGKSLRCEAGAASSMALNVGLYAPPGKTTPMFTNPGYYIKAIAMGNGKDGCDFIESTSGYNRRIFGEFKNFRHVDLIEGICVDYSWGATAHGCNVPVRITDPDNRQSTTIYFLHGAMFQWCNSAIVSNGEIWGSTFSAIFEHCRDEPIICKAFHRCKLAGAWFEGDQSQKLTRLPIKVTSSQQITVDVDGACKFHFGWVAPVQAGASGCGGVRNGSEYIDISNLTGLGARLHTNGLEVKQAGWYGGDVDAELRAPNTNDALATGSVKLIPGTNGSTRNGDVVIESDKESFDGLIKTKAFEHEAVPYYQEQKRKVWGMQTKVPAISDAGDVVNHVTQEAIVLVFDTSLGLEGWQRGLFDVVENIAGEIEVTPKPGVSLQQFAVAIDGVISDDMLVHRISVTNKYSGSWSSYRDPATFKVHFSKLDGTAVTPSRFTILLYPNK